MQTISVLLVLGVSAVAMTTPAVGDYRLLQTIPIAGDDGWDHPTVDSAARRLYVTHGTHVVVIDVDSGKLLGRIDNTPGVHFTVIDPELDRGFISNGGAARLTIFNTNTLETIGQVKSTGENPGPTVFDPATKRVFTFPISTATTQRLSTPKKVTWSVHSTWAEDQNLSARMQKEMFLPT